MKLIDTKVARSTGYEVSVFDAEGWQELPEPGFRWVVRCDEHLYEAWMKVRRDAHALGAEPEAFCPECTEETDFRFTPDFSVEA